MGAAPRRCLEFGHQPIKFGTNHLLPPLPNLGLREARSVHSYLLPAMRAFRYPSLSSTTREVLVGGTRILAPAHDNRPRPGMLGVKKPNCLPNLVNPSTARKVT